MRLSFSDCTRQTATTTAALGTGATVGGTPRLYMVVVRVWIRMAPKTEPARVKRPPVNAVPPTMTAKIAGTLDRVLRPKGVAVMIEAEHQCMSMRGVRKPGVATITTQFTGVFKEDPAQQARFMQLAVDRGR